jgi:Ca2+-binding EF-hand superfamily protein
MSSISGLSNSSNGWAALSAARDANKAKLFAKVDTDSSGGVDATELQTLMDKVSERTGVANSNSATQLMTQLDKNGDGNLNADELDNGITSIVQLPSTMEFAQTRTDSSGATGKAGDDLFSKVDSDGSGGVSASEFSALMDKMSASGDTNASSSSSTSSSDKFAQLDTDGDGSLTQAEFDAGRPQDAGGAKGMGGAGGPQGAGGPPPGGPPPAAASSDSTVYDPLDTNKDGIVSAAEKAAGAANGVTSSDATTSTGATLDALLKAIDTDSDGKLSSSEADTFAKQVATAVDTLEKTSSASDSSKKIDLNQLAQQILKQYAAIAAGQTTTTTGSTVSVTA